MAIDRIHVGAGDCAHRLDEEALAVEQHDAEPIVWTQLLEQRNQAIDRSLQFDAPIRKHAN